MTGAAFFDLDRTLLAGASGTVYSEAMRDSGFVGRSIPGEKLLYTDLQHDRRDVAVDGARPASRHVRPGAATRRDARGRRRRRRNPGGDDPAVRLAAHQRAPRGGSQGGHRHDDAVRPRQAARRLARLRRCHRHALRGQRRRDVRRLDRRAVRVGPRQARRGPRLGRAVRCRSWRELRLLRQRVRHAPAVGGRQSGGRQPRPEHGGDGDAAALAGAPLRRLAGRVQDPRAGNRAAARAPALRPPAADALCPLRHRRDRQHPQRTVPGSS